MKKEAISAGFYKSESWGKQYPKIQIFTISELIQAGKTPDIPPNLATFKKAKQQERQNDQTNLWKK